jgi:hypothetical protein
MQIYSLKNKIISIIFFLLSYTMVIFSTESLIDQTQFKMLIRIIILIPGIFLIVRYFRIPENKLAKIIIFIYLASLCIINGFENIMNTLDFLTLVYIVLLIDLLNKVDVFYKSTLWGMFLALITVFLLVNLGFFENKIYIDQMGRIRFFFGFANPNFLSLYIFSFSIFLYLYKKNNLFLLISIVIIFITIYFTRSRTPFFSFLLFMLLLVYFHKRNIYLKKKISIYLIIMFLLVYIYMVINYQNYINIDLILSGRLRLTNHLFNEISFREFVFGGNLTKITIDNSYLIFIKYYGTFFLIFFLFTLVNVKENRPHELAFIISMLIFGFFESVLVSPAVPVSSLFWYLILQGKRHHQTKLIFQ